MSVDPFVHLRCTRTANQRQHRSEDDWRRELAVLQDHQLLLLAIYISGQCAALEDLSLAGAADPRIERHAAGLRRQAELLDQEGKKRGLNLYGSASPSMQVAPGSSALR